MAFWPARQLGQIGGPMGRGAQRALAAPARWAVLTPGNRVMQIRVARADGTRLKPRHALVRLVGLVLSLPLLWGFVPILMSARRRGVFDVMAGTVVTVIPQPKPRTASVAPLRTEGLVAGAEERI